MRKFEYDVADITGAAGDQLDALNERGLDGWVLIHVEHMGTMQARGYFMRELRETDTGRGNPAPVEPVVEKVDHLAAGVAAQGEREDAPQDAADPNKPDRDDPPPPLTPAIDHEGERQRGPRGHLFEAIGGHWVRVMSPADNSTVP